MNPSLKILPRFVETLNAKFQDIVFDLPAPVDTWQLDCVYEVARMYVAQHLSTSSNLHYKIVFLRGEWLEGLETAGIHLSMNVFNEAAARVSNIIFQIKSHMNGGIGKIPLRL